MVFLHGNVWIRKLDDGMMFAGVLVVHLCRNVYVSKLNHPEDNWFLTTSGLCQLLGVPYFLAQEPK